MITREDGFSLVQVLLLSAVLSVSALVAIQSYRNQKEAIKEVDIKDRVAQVHNMVYSIMQNRNHCMATLRTNFGVTTVTVAPSSTEVLNTINMDDASNAAFTVGSTNRYLNGSVSIADMQLVFPANLTDFATLNIVYNRHGNGKLNRSDTIRKAIQISLQRRTATEVIGCSSVTVNDGTGTGEMGNENVAKEICENLKIFTWDPALRLCVMKKNLCPATEIFVGLDTNGNKICSKLMDFLPHLISPTFTNTCPDDFDKIKLTRDSSPPHLVSIECNKTNETCPSEHKMEWMVGANTCISQIRRGLNGETLTINDVVPSATGTATFSCVAGVWTVGARTCNSGCPAQVLNWSVGGNNCSGSVPASISGTTRTLNDSTAPGTGSSNWLCSSGAWTLNPGSTCAP